MKHFKFTHLIIAIISIASVFTTISSSVFAEDGSTGSSSNTSSADQSVCNNDGVPEEIRIAAGCKPSDTTTATVKDLPNVVTQIVNSIIGITGVVSAIFVVIGGITYITSNGDSSKVKKGKDTILYALIGMVVCALTFVIVNWAISIIEGTANSADTANTASSTDSNTGNE